MPTTGASSDSGDDARRRLELELIEVEKAEMLGTFAGGVAHDFNNLLTGIMGYHELIACELGENSAVQDYIEQARAACVRARGLLEQILTFARQTATAAHAPLDLATLLENTRRHLRLLLPASVAIEIELDPAVPAAPANAAQIQLALLNLAIPLTRTLKATGDTLHLRLHRAAAAPDEKPSFGTGPTVESACIAVANVRQLPVGPAERRVFERSFTTGEMREEDGLGLAIAYRIVRAHRGTLVLERAGTGAEFRMFLPLAAPTVGESAPTRSPTRRGHGEMIYVVDDEDTVATFLRYALEAKGYRVTCFADPAKCLAALAANPTACEVLVTDLSMPGLSGVHLANQARGVAPRLPVLITSGNPLDQPAELAATGPVAVLQKPFTTDELLGAVRAVLPNSPPAA